MITLQRCKQCKQIRISELWFRLVGAQIDALNTMIKNKEAQINEVTCEECEVTCEKND